MLGVLAQWSCAVGAIAAGWGVPGRIIAMTGLRRQQPPEFGASANRKSSNDGAPALLRLHARALPVPHRSTRATNPGRTRIPRITHRDQDSVLRPAAGERIGTPIAPAMACRRHRGLRQMITHAESPAPHLAPPTSHLRRPT
jgi:hypothetical protein